MHGLPSGTVTFAFTDIEGSTELMKSLGERYGEVLGQHRQIVRETFATANGVEIDMQGDAFFFAFKRARDAVGAAVEVQRTHAATEWPEAAVVRVRIGLHTGEPAVGEEGYLGLDVVRAARICTAARGGNVLLSETTRSLVGTTLPDGVAIFPRGERHLKGIDEPERIYELAIDGVDIGEDTEQAPAEAPVPWKQSPLTETGPSEQFGANLAARIQEQVLSSLEGHLAKSQAFSVASAGEDADIEDIASRMTALGERISARVDAALEAKGIQRGDRT